MAKGKKLQEIKVVYEQAKNLSDEEIQRRLSRAYSIIFDAAWELYLSARLPKRSVQNPKRSI